MGSDIDIRGPTSLEFALLSVKRDTKEGPPVALGLSPNSRSTKKVSDCLPLRLYKMERVFIPHYEKIKPMPQLRCLHFRAHNAYCH